MPAQRVNNTNIPPNSAVGYLAMRWSNDGGWAYGTGALINPTNILTCSHNLIDPFTDPPPRGNAIEVRFYPGFNEAREHNPPDGGLAVAVGFFSNLFADGQDAWDVAICRLAEEHLPPAPFTFFTPTITGAEIIDQEVGLTGYPGPANGEMWEDLDQVAGVHIPTNTLIYTHDTWPGNSGSPTWTQDNFAPDGQQVRQHGIHVSRQAQELRRAVLITDDIAQWIAFALAQPTPNAPFLLQGL